MSRLQLERLSKTYGSGAAALHELDLTVEQGEFVALLGPSGCGKTTTLKLIAGLLEPSSGTIRIDGTALRGVPPERRNLAMVFQKPLLFPHLSVGENVAFGLRLRGERPEVIRRRVAEMLELVRLGGMEQRRPQQLSGGQEQRVALARALIVQPQLLLLDEPLSQLDATLRSEIRDLISRIQRELNVTTLLVTHDQEEAVVTADKIALLFHGRLQQYAAPRQFYAQPASAEIARFFGGSNFIAGEKHGAVFRSDLGEFALPPLPHPDGAGLLTIRPEALQLSPGPNQRNATLIASRYLGTHTRHHLRVGNLDLIALSDPSYSLPIGSSVPLSFPPDRLWIVH